MSRTVKVDELSQWHDYNVYTPARLINLDGDIDSDSASEFIKNIRLLDHVNTKDIIILINSEGGSVRAGMDIIDAIKECSSNVITHNIGSCYSMAAIIFQAGDERLISKHASIMIHIGEEGYESSHPKNLKKWMKENGRLGEAADDILYQRIKQKKPRFRKKTFDDLIIFDTIYSAKESIEMGLADKIAEHKELV